MAHPASNPNVSDPLYIFRAACFTAAHELPQLSGSQNKDGTPLASRASSLQFLFGRGEKKQRIVVNTTNGFAVIFRCKIDNEEQWGSIEFARVSVLSFTINYVVISLFIDKTVAADYYWNDKDKMLDRSSHITLDLRHSEEPKASLIGSVVPVPHLHDLFSFSSTVTCSNMERTLNELCDIWENFLSQLPSGSLAAQIKNFAQQSQRNGMDWCPY